MIEHRGFLRGISDQLTAKPGQFLAEKGVPANLVTATSFITGIVGETLAFNNHRIEDWIRGVTGGRFSISAEIVKRFGVGIFGVSLYLDILDGRVARASKSGPTSLGANADNFTDGAVETFISVLGILSAETEVERRTWEKFLKEVRQPSTVRAVGQAHGIPISEIDLGSRLARVPGEILLLASEERRLELAELVSLQARASIVHRMNIILKSGNNEAYEEASMDLILQEIFFEITRIDNPKTFARSLLSQGVSVGFSTLAKAKRTLFSKTTV